MSAATLVERAALDGVEVRLVSGELKVLGDRATVARWLPAIREFDGGYSRQDAEVLAAWDVASALFRRLGAWDAQGEARSDDRAETGTTVPAHCLARVARPDDRHHCRDCARLRNGVCTAAADIGAHPGYLPVDDLPRRCPGLEEAKP